MERQHDARRPYADDQPFASAARNRVHEGPRARNDSSAGRSASIRDEGFPTSASWVTIQSLSSKQAHPSRFFLRGWRGTETQDSTHSAHPHRKSSIPAFIWPLAGRCSVFDQVGRLLVSPGTRANLTKFLLRPVIKMPVRMPAQLDKELTFLLFTFSQLPENITVTMRLGVEGDHDGWRWTKKIQSDPSGHPAIEA